jgi:hypothetical protein
MPIVRHVWIVFTFSVMTMEFAPALPRGQSAWINGAEEGCPSSFSLRRKAPSLGPAPIDAGLQVSGVGLDPFREDPHCKIRRSR